MTELVNTDTGELIDALSASEAERLSTRIRLRLDTMADNYVAVMPMIREAIERRADAALGYNSPGDYISDRFGDALSKLGVEVRREVTRELTAAGLSSRAIAPVVGVSQQQVIRDRQVTHQVSPEPQTEQSADAHPTSAQPARPAVTGIDGKTYPSRKSEPETPRATPRRSLVDQSRDAGWELQKAVERVERIAADDRFTANRTQVAPHLRSHLTSAVEVCQDLLDRINN